MNKNKLLANAIRFLSIDSIEKAKSGHPGMPMGMADIATILWRKHLKHNPENPKWINRDRFILSNGHGSTILYSLLHLTGYYITIKDLKNFRKINSKTPGHPEHYNTEGVETTTGPLGQGLANAVGMALSEKLLSYKFNKKNKIIINHNTYVFVGDGCLMEGISHEASSIAGTLKLNKLVAFWDNNNISIDGNVKGWFTENVKERYKAYDWNVIEINGHSYKEIDEAIIKARKSINKPTMICCRTTIGKGSPNKSNTKNIHGSPLGKTETNNTRKNLNWPYKSFEIIKDIYEKWNMKKEGIKLEEKWKENLKKYKKKNPVEYEELKNRLRDNISKNFNKTIKLHCKKIIKNNSLIATRKSSQLILKKIYNKIPQIFGGSADLTESNLTSWNNVWVNDNKKQGNYLSYGVREFGMASIMNGMSLHGGFKPFGGTFLVFSDYCRNAIRMSAIMKLPIIYIMTHDSIGLGEDGPTHQPIEQIPSLRLIPNLNVWRPADSIETTVAWDSSIKEKQTPSVITLSRQNLPTVIQSTRYLDKIKKGGYIISKSHKMPILSLISTGSEVEIILETEKILFLEEVNVNIISIPCIEKFYEESKKYQKIIIPENIPALIIEATQNHLWYKLLPKKGGKIIGINKFGESAPKKDLYKHFKLNVKNCIGKIEKIIN